MQSVGSVVLAVTQLAAAVLIGSVLGRTLDLRLQSSPWCLIAGVALGTAAGVHEILQAFRTARTQSDGARSEP